jgi:UDP-N-acetylglucosamine pyrophosphorylase
MSPNFRRTTAPKALRALVSACESREEVRERILAALTLARGTSPQLQYEGTRAVFDLRGKGLPYNQLVVEKVDKRWYIAD